MIKRTAGPIKVVHEMNVEATDGYSLTGTNDAERNKANAAHIVACWNACEGLNPAVVPDMLAMLKRIYEGEEPTEIELFNLLLKADTP